MMNPVSDFRDFQSRDAVMPVRDATLQEISVFAFLSRRGRGLKSISVSLDEDGESALMSYKMMPFKVGG